MNLNTTANIVILNLKCCEDRQVLCQRLSYYFGEINAVHPFRDGNGRAQRMFFQFLCRNLGYDLDFTQVSSEDMLEASVRSFDLDYNLLETLINKALTELQENEKD